MRIGLQPNTPIELGVELLDLGAVDEEAVALRVGEETADPLLPTRLLSPFLAAAQGGESRAIRRPCSSGARLRHSACSASPAIFTVLASSLDLAPRLHRRRRERRRGILESVTLVPRPWRQRAPRHRRREMGGQRGQSL